MSSQDRARTVVFEYRASPALLRPHRRAARNRKRRPIKVDGFTAREFDAFAGSIARSWRIARNSPAGVGLYRLRIAEHQRTGGSGPNEEELKIELVRLALAEVWSTRLMPQELGGTVVRPWLDLSSTNRVRWLVTTALETAERRLTKHS